MKLSRYFLPVLKEVPAEANIVSHQMMLRCGMIKQTTAGIYSWLPLGFKVLKKIEDIVHDEQIKAGHIPMLMPTIQPAELWQESGRYDDYGKEMLRIKDRQDRNYLYGPTYLHFNVSVLYNAKHSRLFTSILIEKESSNKSIIAVHSSNRHFCLLWFSA